jgi:hypothetical protein
VSAQAGACDAEPLPLQPHAAAPAGAREPRTAGPLRPAHTSAYTYEAHRPSELGRSQVETANADRRRAASVLWYWLLVLLVVAARGMGAIARSVVVAARGYATTRPRAPKRCAAPNHAMRPPTPALRAPSASPCDSELCFDRTACADGAVADPRVAAGAHRKRPRRPARSLGRRRWPEPSASCAARAFSRCS